MKVVKLNRRFKKFRERGHTVGLRFSEGYSEAVPYESATMARLGYNRFDGKAPWTSYFGARNGRNTVRPYWITFRNESDATLVLLSVYLTKKP